jgi:probable aminopeptidase NPEPL1
LVGKGIVYDTGGLALKPKEGMCGMKADMGGAAGLMGAFEAAVAIGTPVGPIALHCVLCLAENAIGPTAFRNDDVLTFLSGRTCEINNTDAEGRLVLSDGVAHATALPPRLPGLTPGAQPDLVIDMATLTGAQMIATGKRFAAIFTNDEATELAAVAAGRRTGDLVHPLYRRSAQGLGPCSLATAC